MRVIAGRKPCLVLLDGKTSLNQVNCGIQDWRVTCFVKLINNPVVDVGVTLDHSDRLGFVDIPFFELRDDM